jgi:4-cresol dehydrogenase (hydroxylating) flavoprotein subunit
MGEIQFLNSYKEKLNRELNDIGIEIFFDIESKLKDCSGFRRKVSCVISPTTHQQVRKTVEVLNKLSLSFYTVSMGKNWGYGSALPANDSEVLIDLSRMKTISKFNSELGTIDIEPGVTQQELYEFLKAEGDHFFVPTTGAGPHVSVLGNALDRGFGVTPIEDHARSIVSLQAVLGSGEVYKSYFRSLGSELGACYHWGVGASIDGIFSQSNMGLVTEATIELVKKPEVTSLFVFPISNENEFKSGITALAKLKAELPYGVGTLKIISAQQLNTTIGQSTWLTRRLRGNALWTGVGVLHGKKSITLKIKKEVATTLRGCGFKKIRFINKSQVKFLEWLTQRTFLKDNQAFRDTIRGLGGLMDLAHGIPSQVGMKMIYPDEAIENFANKDPVRDGKGLIWFSPICPLSPEEVFKLLTVLKETLIRGGFSSTPITFTTLNNRCMAAVVPIIFDPLTDSQIAHGVYLSLLQACGEQGFYPYRIPIEFMNEALRRQPPEYWAVFRRLKKALDPQGLFAQGRYLP